MELNPNNPLVRQARDHWHKIAALIMIKQGLKEIRFSIKDVEKLSAGNVNIVIDGRQGRLTGDLIVKIVDDTTAAELARREGGRPQDC